MIIVESCAKLKNDRGRGKTVGYVFNWISPWNVSDAIMEKDTIDLNATNQSGSQDRPAIGLVTTLHVVSLGRVYEHNRSRH